MNLPIQLTEIEVNEKWEPDLKEQYLVEFQWIKDIQTGKSHWIIGTFHKVWFGYTFHWFWSASSLQLGMSGKGALKVSDDWKQFKRVYLFEPHPEPDFIEKGEVEL